MARNVEIKARVKDFISVQKLAMALSGGPPKVVIQKDVFFQSPQGRLKLRQLAPDLGELIYYDRPDFACPKTSTYSISHTDDPTQLRAVLGAALGEKIAVNKTREVYLVGPTRIHLDLVEGLGEFMELEVVLEAEETKESGQTTAFKLMGQLGIKRSDLVEGAYADLLAAKPA